jgi:hypothetical protein
MSIFTIRHPYEQCPPKKSSTVHLFVCQVKLKCCKVTCEVYMRIKTENLLFTPELLTRQVNRALVSACMRGTGTAAASSLDTIRVSQTFSIPSDEAEATMAGNSPVSDLDPKIATPLIRLVCAFATDQASSPDLVSQALTTQSSPPVTRKLS